MLVVPARFSHSFSTIACDIPMRRAGPGLSAMFGAAEEGYASDPGPRSLGFSNPGAYTWLANLYLDGPGLGRWARATARRGPGAIGPGL